MKKSCENCGNQKCKNMMVAVLYDACLKSDYEKFWQPQTNADRIRAMSDEGLADFVNDAEYGFLDRPGMCDVCDHHRVKDCLACWLDWLKSPVEEGDK